MAQEEPDYKVTAGRPDTSTRAGQLKMRYPTIGDLRARARKRVPRFAFDYWIVDDPALGKKAPKRPDKSFRYRED